MTASILRQFYRLRFGKLMNCCHDFHGYELIIRSFQHGGELMAVSSEFNSLTTGKGKKGRKKSTCLTKNGYVLGSDE